MSLAYRPLPVPRIGVDASLLTHLEQTQDQLRRVFAGIPTFTITSAAANDTLRFDGTDWVNTNLFQVTATEARISHGTNAALDFYIGGTRRAGLSVTASDVLRFTDSGGTVKLQFQMAGNAGEIIPPSTSLSFRNNADSADNLLIADAGDVTARARAAVGGALAASVQFNLTPAVGSRGFVVVGATQTTSQPVFDAAQTWNAGAVVFTGIKLNVTNTASSVNSLLIDLQLGGASKFSVTRDGTLVAGSANIGTGTAAFTGPVTITPTSGLALSVQAVSGQYAAEFKGAGSRSVEVNADGALEIGWPSITTNLVPVDVSVAEWNAGGVAFTLFRLAVTNTASAAGSRLLKIEVDGGDKFSVDVSGFVYVNTQKVVGGRVTGYTAMTGTANRATSYATSTITLEQLAQRVKAIQDDLTTHGLIGA